MTPTPPTSAYIISHILTHLSHTAQKPLFVAVQGPQGSGKTFVTNQVRTLLSAPPHNLHLAVLSLDDLYLPHSELAALSGNNPLLRGRGLPGTHDVPLGLDVLRALTVINEPGAPAVKIPAYDKSAHAGQGDRVPGEMWESVSGPVDVVILEGWCVGFAPVVDASEMDRKWKAGVKGLEDRFSGATWLESKGIRREHVMEVNECLKKYLNVWDMFSVFVQISTPPDTPYSPIYAWRTEQEHALHASKGAGMTDDEVTAFVDRYIPGYIFFADGVTSGWIHSVEGGYATADVVVISEGAGREGKRKPPLWTGRGLRVIIGERRQVLEVINF